MNINNKEILERANAAVAAGDNEGFLSFCTDDVKWIFVGDQTLEGKDAVRQYMAATYLEPPRFMVENLIAGDEFVTAIGTISMKDADGEMVDYAYCDVWRFRDGKMAELKAFVIKTGPK
ncbi:MAG: nuclear transport factor 2 family protein [Pseudobacter sp.]|uniref:nuclear transport factor 2 family protein n=1 Tax=Pseudobacter sp. TaxID=2045420 RepID=UPI003F80FF3F